AHGVDQVRLSIQDEETEGGGEGRGGQGRDGAERGRGHGGKPAAEGREPSPERIRRQQVARQEAGDQRDGEARPHEGGVRLQDAEGRPTGGPRLASVEQPVEWERDEEDQQGADPSPRVGERAGAAAHPHLSASGRAASRTRGPPTSTSRLASRRGWSGRGSKRGAFGGSRL